MGLLRLDVVHGILGSSAPTLDDDGEQEDDEACRAGNSEYPGAERDAIGMANISHATQVLTLENVVCCIILRKFCFAKVATIN